MLFAHSSQEPLLNIGSITGFFLRCGIYLGTHWNVIFCHGRQIVVVACVGAVFGVWKGLVVSALGVSLGSGFTEANSKG